MNPKVQNCTPFKIDKVHSRASFNVESQPETGSCKKKACARQSVERLVAHSIAGYSVVFLSMLSCNPAAKCPKSCKKKACFHKRVEHPLNIETISASTLKRHQSSYHLGSYTQWKGRQAFFLHDPVPLKDVCFCLARSVSLSYIFERNQIS